MRNILFFAIAMPACLPARLPAMPHRNKYVIDFLILEESILIREELAIHSTFAKTRSR
jgi:hypothetical protein